MQDFIDSYKATFDINVDVTLDTSIDEGEIKVSENGYKINESKDANVLETLGKIKLHTLINDPRVFKPSTEFMATLMLAWVYGTMSKQLEVVEMDLLLEKLLIKKEDSPYDSYAVLKVIGANPTLSGADSSLMDSFLILDPSKELLDQIEKIEEE